MLRQPLGQAGAMLAAWLQQLGVKYLVVDKAARPGDAGEHDTTRSNPTRPVTATISPS